MGFTLLWAALATGLTPTSWAGGGREQLILELTQMLRGSNRPYSQYIMETRAVRGFTSSVLGAEARTAQELRELCGRLSLDELAGFHRRVQSVYNGTRINPHLTVETLSVRHKNQLEALAAEQFGADFTRAVTWRLVSQAGVQSIGIKTVEVFGQELKAAAQAAPSVANAYGAQAIANRKFLELAAFNSTRAGYVEMLYAHEKLTAWVSFDDLLTFLSHKNFVRRSQNAASSGLEIDEAFRGVRELGEFFNLAPSARSAGLAFDIPERVRRAIHAQYPELATIDYAAVRTAQDAELLLRKLEALFGTNRIILYTPNPEGLIAVTQSALR